MELSTVRIGNIIYENKNLVHKSKDGLHFVSATDFEFGIDNCEPIPLTNEWIKRTPFVLSFSDTGYPNNYDFGQYRIYSYDNDYFIFCKMYQGNYVQVTDKIKFVHQLQNIYQSIELSELEIKLS